MKETGKYTFRADSFDILNTAWRYRKLLIITAIGAFILSAALTYLITPLYRSAAVVYPSSVVSEKQSVTAPQTGFTEMFGDEEATEKLLQVLKSDPVKDHLVKKFNLMSHYGIDLGSKFAFTALERELRRKVSARKTQFGSVEISVLDSDPHFAADLANEAVITADSLFNALARGVAQKKLNSLRTTYSEASEKLNRLADSLSVLKRKGLKIPSDFTAAGSTVASWSRYAGEADPAALRLMNLFESENSILSSLASVMAAAANEAGTSVTYIHVINSAKPSDKKELPRRSAIVLVSVLSVILILLLGLALKESISRNGEPE